ncbi:hypothetical protein [uncultured Celeribacter sp.]|uniref:hypothetical protein n=1 Tax=uncultured Celeribacter sp. TaxID=1303376 RepID=UPI002AA80796|nr:hypothetical protein [uncultured Celeribacter sp.]
MAVSRFIGLAICSLRSDCQISRAYTPLTKKLKEFKAWCQNNGIYNEFEDIKDFGYHFQRHLSQMLAENDYLKSFLAQAKALVDDMSQEQEILVSFSSLEIRLLYLASQDDHGQITIYEYIGGVSFSAGGVEVEHNNTRRAIAKIEAAIEKLETYNLIVDSTSEGRCFQLTQDGYEALDKVPEKYVEKLMQDDSIVE